MSTSPKKGVDWDRLVRLFRPGRGVMPPELAGREKELTTLKRFRADLADKRPPPSDAILYGPRGNGKTVLLKRFREECLEAGTEAGIAALRLSASEIKTPEALARELLAAHPAEPQDGAAGKLAHIARHARDLPAARDLEMKHVEAGVKGGMPGVAGGDVHLSLERIPPERLAGVLRGRLAERCAKKPLAVIIDEAHTLDLDVGHRLLNLSQDLCDKDAPFLLVLAGTPGIKAHLRKMDASFWERSKRIGIGRLDKGAARKALAEPLKDFGIAFDEAALAAAVEESQRYPYFLQLWGEALCQALAEEKATRIDAEIVALARPAFEHARTAFYEGRYAELQEQGLRPEAEAAAALFAEASEPDPQWPPRKLEGRLRDEDGLSLSEKDALEAIDRLSHLGLVWQPPGSEHLEAGIPSLMGHVLQKAEEIAPDIGAVSLGG